ncbi:capsular polysaccharide export protein [Pseudomonas duriflava]|uniref:Capsular polysaccharide export protein n=1 Tax=Pseudomonas duriflava TaxID=459528 RepID=A0A562QDU7_9PSED|nr:capsular biosynthesis protein [Pseudomonas duriflava]TWI54206.1 capsular polysaccharide export protein [Pseudomonas duriflava]
MTDILFFSLAKHQNRYFKDISNVLAVSSQVITLQDLPLPSLKSLDRAVLRLDFPKLIEEKCQERQIKGKYHGVYYRLALRLEMLWVALRMQAWIKRKKPQALAVWNGSNRYCQLFSGLLPQEAPRFYFENGLLPNTTTLDTKGVNFHNSVPRDGRFYQDYAATVDLADQSQAVKLIPRKPRASGQQEVALPERFFFIPFQDDRDSQVRYFSPYIRNMRELFNWARQLNQVCGIPIVLKEHPSSREQYPDLHDATHEGLFFANGNSTQELIEKSLAVLTINSTVGLEAILLGKPVVTLGQAFYTVEGVCEHADSLESLIELVKRYPDWMLNSEVRLAFLHYLSNQYCVPGRWQDSGDTHLREVARRMEKALLGHSGSEHD